MPSGPIAAALRAAQQIDDCRVIERQTSEGAPETVVYAVPSAGCAPDDAAACVTGLHTGDGVPLSTVILPSAPLADSGEWDPAALETLAVIDATTLARAEEIARQASGLSDVAAVATTRAAAFPAWHLSALLPDWVRPSMSMGGGAHRADTTAAALHAHAPHAVSDGGELLIPAGSPTSLGDLLLRAADVPAPAGVVVVRADGHEAEIGYAELLDQARRILTGLRAQGLGAGAHLVLQLRRHDDFLATFWACVLGGIVPVPVGVPPSFGEANGALRRVADAIEMFESPVIAADAAALAGLRQAATVLPLKPHRTFDVDALRRHEPATELHAAAPDDVALMMLTSGSTGRPKGVPQPHRNLLARTFGSQQMHGWARGMVTLNWMPLDHVAGLIYFHLRDVHLAARQIHVGAEEILRTPLLWLDLLERHRVEVSFAPNFAFGLVCGQSDAVARRRWNLSSVRRILNGGEAIVAAPTRRFLQLLAGHGLQPDVMMPAWGMSEVSSGVTYEDGFRLETTADNDQHVKVGRPIPGVRMRVVDDGGRLLREGQVGQLELAGATVFAGYFGSAQKLEDTFTPDGWFRTGDLARLDDGHLTITGRDKDVIIINGANYAGPAIEAAVEELAGVERSFTAACAIADARADGSEGLALFVVPETNDDRSLAELLRAIRQKVVQSFGISPAVIVPLARDAIPKTSIGKIQRGALQKALQQGQFESELRRVDVLSANEHTLPRWFFRRTWHRSLAPSGGAAAGFSCLLFGRADDALAQAFTSASPDTVLVERGAAFDRVGVRHFRVGADLRGDIARVVSLLRADGTTPVHAVWLWGLDAAPGVDLAARCVASSRELIDSVQGLTAHAGPMALAVVTRRAVSVDAQEASIPERALLGALVLTLVQEHQDCRAVHVDIDDETPERLVPRIVDELTRRGEQREVAWRGSERRVALLEPLALDAAASAPSPLRRGGAYVVTGGLGGIGVELSAWLLRKFDARVLLLSRQPLPTDADGAPEQQSRLAAWRRLQGISPHVAHAAVDVRDAAAMRQALDTWGTPPDAVFHLAAAYHELALADETGASLEAAFGAKVGGLDALLAARHAGTAVICFSSVASVFAGALVGAYAAASRALDAAAAHAGVWSLDWSGWHDTGLTRRFGAREPLRAMGVLDLAPAQALASLQVALTQAAGPIVIGLAGEAPYVARRAVGITIEQTVTAFCETTSPLRSAAAPVLRDRFGVAFPLRLQPIDALPRGADGRPDRAALEGIVRHGGGFRAAVGPVERKLVDIWRSVLGLQAISTDASFFELGGQSLLASQLITAIGADFGVHWSLRDVFEAPTVAAQAARLAARDTAGQLAATRADRGSALPLGSAQRRLWFLDQVHPNNSAFNIAASVRFAHRPDPGRVRRALQAIVDRHEVLRTRFPLIDGLPQQVVATQQAVQLDVQTLPDGVTLEQRAETLARQPFDLAAGPLLRAHLVELADGGAVLLLSLHHIISDGWSMKVLFRDWQDAYRSDAPLPPLALQYADFAQWQRAHAASARYAQQLDHWRTRLGDRLEGFALPTDQPRPAVQTYRGAVVKSRLPASLTRRVRMLARRQGVTLFVTLLAAYKALLARYAQQHDVVVGTVVANRDRAEFETLMGFIVNVVVLRTDLGADPRFADILQRVHHGVLDAYANHEVPFEALVDALQPPRDTSRSPLFQIAFDVRDPEITRSIDPGLRFGVMEPDLGAAQYDLHLTLEESHDAESALTALWQYNTDLFRRDTVERMAGNFETLLADAVAEPGRRLSELALLHADELAFVHHWNQRHAAFARGRCMHQLFEAHAQRTPARVALQYGGETVSYAALEARSNAWAHRLQAAGVGRDVIVGLCLERSTDLVVAMLAILKAGGAFLPLDPTYPQDRLDHMIADSGIVRLLTHSRLADRFTGASPAGLQVLAIDAPQPDAPLTPPPCDATDRSLAYVIYTSGSTGRPKGVLVEHHGWCNVAQAQQDVFGLRPGMRVLQFASSSFDACAFEVCMALASGGTLVLASSDELMPGPGLARLLREQQVQVVTLPPTALAALPDGEYPQLEVITVAGEACPLSLVQRFARPSLRFFNLYGPTEATIWSSVAECRQDDSAAPSIGVPVPNVSLYVLDAQRRLLPRGMPGELYIGGEGITRGYHQRPELDAERFFADPFATAVPGGGRLYRSGDVVRLNAAAELEFLGRSDHQVKLRGFRIELGEIESVLRGCAGVGEVLVALRKLADGDDALVAYATPAAGSQLDAEALRRHLRAVLPQYMVPAWIVPLTTFPLTPNGKVDRARLPDPQHQAAGPSGPADLPQNELEQTIAEVWREVLGTATIDRRQNFFDAGGHSIKMAQVHSRLSPRLQRPLALVDLFQYPTVAALAAFLAAPATQAGAAAPAAGSTTRPAAPDGARLRPDAQRLAALAERQRAARGRP